MRFASALTTKTDWVEAVGDLGSQVSDQLGAAKTQLAVLFAHPKYVPHIDEIIDATRKGVGAEHLLGCTGAGIIGNNREVEETPALTLLVGELPGVTIYPFHLAEKDLEESTGPAFWHYQLELEPSRQPQLLVLVDPFTTRAMQLVDALAEAYPHAPMIGGLASGAQQPGENRLFVGGKVYDEGAVGIGLTGHVALRSVVSQGCRPIGEPMTVTRAEKNIVFELAGRPPMKILQEMLPQLPTRDRDLARSALFLGRVVNEYQDEFSRGDFLIRNLIGSDPQSGALAVGDVMRTGQTVQFQVRDAQTADEDLRHLLAKERTDLAKTRPQGALLFSCLGRGERMYGTADHDIQVVQQNVGPVPTAGFFCNGEIGPVGSRAFIHGFTSVIGLFTEPAE
ncbi:MAG TPA: FIST N-terminal domain-containing protein [Verrucomicrobiae bacterium]|nr:FIST N-terminal domain-containing protein [Verrucomicrobiae bacterium]